MNDPWDVKSVRKSNQYISCMKLNGVPLLPPVLSRECRKEMQYYKVLSKEVEKRISILKPFVSGDCDSVDDKTDGNDVPGQSFELPLTNSETGFDFNINKILALPSENYENKDVNTNPSKVYQSITSNVTVTSDSTVDTPKLIIDLSLSIKEGGKSILTSIQKSPQSPGTRTPPSPPLEPEHDCAELEFDIPQKELMNEVNTISEKAKCLEETVNRAFNQECKSIADPFLDGIPLRNEGPSSLSSKSFTGSLHDIHSVSAKDPEVVPTLIRQHSYTVLNPSPQLLAHLEVQSLNTGVEVTSISMSDSQSNIDSNTNGKKRRSWDLESAKVKWSSMALELKGTGIPSVVKPRVHGNATSAVSQSVVGQNASPQNKLTPKKVPSSITPPSKVRSAALDYARKSTAIRSPQKSEPIHRPHTMPNTQSNNIAPKEPLTPQSKTVTKEATPKVQTQQTETKTDKEAEGDPAIRIRELYEKIQKQQLAQMANLIEKQKREQMFLQRVFEEQNNMLCSQLKTICPKISVDINKAWTDNEDDRGPVSLSQLIDARSPDRGRYEGSADTLQMTNNCINKCDNVLKQSKNITSSIRKLSPRVSSVNGRTVLNPDVGQTSTTSPSIRNTSRKLNYDSAASTDVDLMFTDRTNDTLADLQSVSFPSDVEETQLYHEAVTVQPKTQSPRVGSPNRTTDSAIRSLEHTIKNSINSMSSMNGNCNRRPANQTSSVRVATSKEHEAATRIVAHAKGYLVRRLMRTERVQATVQTIRDALLCALELHKDREGIRGADVDLHRRLIQQITAACYTLHDTFVGSSPAERCAAIAADRRRRAAPRPQPSPSMARTVRYPDIMSHSYSGSFPARTRRASSASIMTQSNYETFNINKCNSARYMPSPRRRPWR